MKKTIMFTFSMVLAILVFASAGTAVYSQMPTLKGKGKKAELGTDKSTKSEAGSKGATDPNIKVENRVNSETKMFETPVKAGGAKGAAGACGIRFDNYTNLYIRTYVDGSFEGMLSRMGETIAYAVSGTTVVYARADSEDGSVRTWGPRTFNCEAGSVYT